MKLSQMFSNVTSLGVLKPSELLECYGDHIIDAITGKKGYCTFIIFDDSSAVLVSDTASIWFKDPAEATAAVMGTAIREHWNDFPGLPEIREKFMDRIKAINGESGDD